MAAAALIPPNVNDPEALFRRRVIAALAEMSARPVVVAIGTATLSVGTSTTIPVDGATGADFALVVPADADAAALGPYVSAVTNGEIEITHDSGTGGAVTYLVVAPGGPV